MASLFHAAGHGLSAGDAVYFGNLVPADCGLVEGQTYYVLAEGLTTDDFEVSDTDGGTAIVFDFDIESGVVSLVATYTPVSDPDDVMAPPTTPTTPDSPSIASVVNSGLVRLQVLLSAYTDSATRVRLTEVQYTHKYATVIIDSDPPEEMQVPDWDYAQVLNFPPGATELTVPAVPNAGYAFRARVQDVFGNYSGWSNPVELTAADGSDALQAALADISNDVQDGVITAVKIGDNAIEARHISANSVTADALAATLVLASLIQTAASGRRVEIDEFGIRLVDASGEYIVNIPTDADQPVFFKGEIVASKLTAQLSNDLSGSVALSGDGILTLANGVAAPTIAPTIATSVDSLTKAASTGSIAAAAGIAYDSGAGTFWVACDPTVSPYYVAQEFDKTTGALVRSISATGSITTYTTTAGSTSHVSDTAQAYSGSTNSHIATPITMPSGRDNMQITKVSVYLAGYGGSATCYNCLWNDVSGTGNFVKRSDAYTAASAAFGNGNSAQYNKTLTSPYAVSAGTIYAGVYHSSSGDGIQYDRDDGSGKSTYGGDGSGTSTADFDGTGWGALTASSKPNVYVTYTYDVDTRLETAPMIGVATDGTYVYTLDTNGVVWKYLRSDGSYVAKSSALSLTGTKSLAGLFYDATAAKLVITHAAGTTGTDQAKFSLVDPAALTISSTLTATGAATFNGATAALRGGARLNDPLNSNTATYWVPIGGTVKAFNASTGAYTANRDFGTTATVNSGLTHDGTVFRGWAIASPTKVWTFSAWDFTTTSTTLWVGYAWYDSAGTTHETAMGPRSSVTIRRRERVLVTTPAIPSGGADDPDKVRIYALQNATDTGAGAHWLQITDALTSRFMTTYAGSGTHDGAGTAFPAGTPAEMKSSATGWSLKGDGSATFDDVTVGGDLGITGDLTPGTLLGSTVTSGSGTITVANGGTATWTTKTFEWVKIGRLVVMKVSSTVNAAGSGSSAVTFTFPDSPIPATTSRVWIDRGGTGVTPLVCRLVSDGTQAQFSAIATAAAPTTSLTGANLASGAGYSGTFAYMAAS